MKNTSTFQILLLTVFGVLIIVGVGVFAAFGGFIGGTSVGAVSIWGTEDSAVMTNLLEALREQDTAFEGVTYAQKSEASYETDLLNALASGNGPDLVILPSQFVQYFRDKTLAISYGSMSQSEFISSYVEEARILLTPSGILGLPLVIDPLVMYWNTESYASAGIAEPPQYWTELNENAPKLTAIDSTKNVTRSAVALGTWNNITNAKSILSALIMQAGDVIVSADAQGVARPVFGSTPQGAAETPAASALRFYTQFANPSQSVYSWNRSLPADRDAFAAGDLATYFGFASELPIITARNPNLRFSADMLPQIQSSSVRLTAGNMLVLLIPRTARNPSGAFAVAALMTGRTGNAAVAHALRLPAARRDLLGDDPSSALATVISRSALISRSWLDPSPQKTEDIFKTMIESVTSGLSEPSGAVSVAAKEFEALFPRSASAPQ